MKKTNVNQMVRAALLIALGLVLPYLFHGVKDAGSIFLPMHIPVLVAGFVLAPEYALAVGVLTPLLSHVFTGMPPFPFVYVMTLELATYGLAISLLNKKFKLGVYVNLIIGMLAGRAVNILGSYVILHMIMSKPFKLKLVVTGLFVKGLPGIAIQLVLIPLLVMVLKKNSIKSATDNV